MEYMKKNKGFSENPKVSIVIPMYNVELYIEECLRSLSSQTYDDFEIICVDDGSDDRTVEIVKKLMADDRRIHLYEHPHCGRAGVIRNFGMEKAHGDYFLFLDGDDFFEKEMIEKVMDKIKEDEADVCVFGARKYMESTKVFKKYNAINEEYIPDQLPFEGKTFPYIFNICSATPWSKMFKRSLIEKWHIQFMPLERSNDVFFVRFAMAMAQRITILNEVLVNYRQSSGSLQATNDKTPLDWYSALLELKEKLYEYNIFDNVEQSFINYCLSLGMYHLNTLKSGSTFCQLYDELKFNCFVKLGVIDYDPIKFYSYNDQKSVQLEKMKRYTSEEYLFEEYSEWAGEEGYWRDRRKKAEQEMRSIKQSFTFKIGKAALFIPGKVKSTIGDKNGKK